MAKKKSRLTRDNFIPAWLTATPAGGVKKFTDTTLVENRGKRAAIEPLLAQTVFLHHHLHPDSYKKNLAALGYPGAAEQLDRRPKAPKTRMGNFGEVIAAEVLKQIKGYEVPVLRLRHSMNSESSPKGDDVLAFEFEDSSRGTKDTIIVVEAKARTTHNAETVTDAHDALTKVYRPRPKSLTFVADVLRHEGRDDLADKVVGFLNKFRPKPFAKKSILFLLTGNQPREPFKCIEELDTVVPGLEAIHLRLEGLPVFVKRIFEVEVDADEL